MRLTVKLGLASALGITAVAGLYGKERLDREVSLFEDDMRRDHLTFGRALGLSAHVVAARHGFDEAKETIAATNKLEAAFLIEFLEGVAPESDYRPLEFWDLIGRDAPPDLVTTIAADLGRPGYVRITEPRAAEVQWVRDTAMRVVTSLLVSVALSLGIILTFGWWFVGHPLRKLVDKVRRIGEGDLSAPLVLADGGEMGLLAREINAMCEQLDEAQRRVAAEADARVRTLEQLRHADRLSTVGKLSSGIAHELGTPLNVAGARAKMILSGESTGTEVHEDSRVILEQTERMARIIRQLLDFARRGTAQRRKEDVRAVVEASLRVLSPLASRGRVKVELEQGPPAEASVDAEQMQQVVMNVVMNAVQAQRAAGKVDVRVWREEGHVHISVRDEGVGMSNEVRERIFEPFFTTKDVGQGTGLGLSVVHGIIVEHGGSIDVESAPEQGTTVTVHLPVGGDEDE